VLPWTSRNLPVTVVTYTNDNTLGDFTGGVTYAIFTRADSALTEKPLPYTPTATDVAAGSRILGFGDNPPIELMFPSPVSKIRVFPNMDHLGDAYDGY
jgi:hypothetical protein